MPDAPYVHIGVLVDELDAAIKRFSALGLTFMQPRTVQVEHLVEDGIEKQIDLRIAFSHQGPTDSSSRPRVSVTPPS